MSKWIAKVYQKRYQTSSGSGGASLNVFVEREGVEHPYRNPNTDNRLLVHHSQLSGRGSRVPVPPEGTMLMAAKIASALNNAERNANASPDMPTCCNECNFALLTEQHSRSISGEDLYGLSCRLGRALSPDFPSWGVGGYQAIMDRLRNETGRPASCPLRRLKR